MIAQGEARSRSKQYMPALDGLRAVAIVAVMITHLSVSPP